MIIRGNVISSRVGCGAEVEDAVVVLALPLALGLVGVWLVLLPPPPRVLRLEKVLVRGPSLLVVGEDIEVVCE